MYPYTAHHKKYTIEFNHVPGFAGSFDEPGYPEELDVGSVRDKRGIVTDYDRKAIEEACWKVWEVEREMLIDCS